MALQPLLKFELVWKFAFQKMADAHVLLLHFSSAASVVQSFWVSVPVWKSSLKHWNGMPVPAYFVSMALAEQQPSLEHVMLLLVLKPERSMVLRQALRSEPAWKFALHEMADAHEAFVVQPL